jgi:integrase
LVGAARFELATPSLPDLKLEWTWEDDEPQIPYIRPAFYLYPQSCRAAPGRGKTWEDTKNLPRVFPKRGVFVKLTQANITDAKKNAAKSGKSDYVEWDDELKGFGLRIRGDACTWIFQYKLGTHKKMRLGKLSEIDAKRARTLADALKGQVAGAKLGHGVEPAETREKKKEESQPTPKPKSLGATIEQYLSDKAGKPRSLEETARHLRTQWVRLHRLPLGGVTRADLAARLATLAKDSGPVAANRARASLSAFYRWAIGEGLCDANPVAGTNKREENGPRERSLSDAEAAAVWLAAPDNDYGRIIRLILLTGCRRDELGSLRWSEVDLKARTLTLPPERTKNRQTHVVPLSEPAMAVLGTANYRADREPVFGIGKRGFSGWSKAKSTLDAAAKLKEEWTLHDLRRTVRTGLGKLGVAPHVAEAVLNHLPPRLIRTHDRNTYTAEKGAALDLWATHLQVAVAQATGANVTQLRKS